MSSMLGLTAAIRGWMIWSSLGGRHPQCTSYNSSISATLNIPTYLYSRLYSYIASYIAS